MSFSASFREGRGAARAARGASPPRPCGRPPAPPTPGAPSPIKLGYHCDLNGEHVGGPLLSNTERNILMLGLNGAGKSTRFLIELMMTTSHRSLFVFDVKGELAWQTAAERARYSDVFFINPHRLHGLPSDGFNPLMLDPDDDLYFSHLTDIGTAAIDLEEKDKHWSQSAQSLLEGFTGWEIQRARREKRLPSFANVRRMVCEPDEYEEYIDAKGRRQRRLIKGISHTARRIMNEGGDTLAGLVSRFVREHGQNELSGIQSTFDTQTKWTLDPMMAADGAKPGVDFNKLRTRPTTVYVILHPLEVRKNRRWTRLVISSALCALMRPGPVKTLCVLDEFYATVGNLPILNDVWSLVRGYGCQLMPIVQSALHLKTLFNDEWENYAAQAGLCATLGPANDLFTAKWMSERCGVTTILQSGFNLGDGINAGDGTSTGTGSTGAGSSSNQGNSFNNGRSRNGGISYQQTERRVLLPQEIMDIRAVMA